MKGITAVVAIILLLLIIIAIVGLAFTFLTGLQQNVQNETAESTGIQVGNIQESFSIVSTSGNKVYVRNTGPRDLQGLNFFVDGDLVQPMSPDCDDRIIKPQNVCTFELPSSIGTHDLIIVGGSKKQAATLDVVECTDGLLICCGNNVCVQNFECSTNLFESCLFGCASGACKPAPSTTTTTTVPPASTTTIPVITWARQFGTDSSDSANSVSTDASGNVYVAGDTYGALLGPNAGDTDAFVRKYDSDGNEIWTRQFGAAFLDRAITVSAYGSDNIYVAGGTNGALFGSSAGSTDAFVRKYDSDGNEIWAKQFGTSNYDMFWASSTDASGNIYLTGETLGSLSGPNAGDDILTLDAFVRKYDSDGNEIWTRQFGSRLDETLRAVSAYGSDNIYVAGHSNGELPGQTSNGIFIRKYDSDGNEIWTRMVGGDYYSISSVSTDASGNVYIAGEYEPGTTYAFVRKYDSDGNEIWAREFGGSGGRSFAYSVSTDASSVYVAGGTSKALSGPNAGMLDAFIRKYDSDGNEIWTRQFGSANGETADSVSAYGSDNIYVAGGTGGSLFESNAGDTDVFIIRNP